MTIPVSKLPDKDMQNVAKALVRAAKRAREIAKQTGTAIIVMRNGKLIREIPQPEIKGEKGEHTK